MIALDLPILTFLYSFVYTIIITIIIIKSRNANAFFFSKSPIEFRGFILLEKTTKTSQVWNRTRTNLDLGWRRDPDR